MSLVKCLQEILEEDTPLSYAMLIELSSLSLVEEEQFKGTWGEVVSKRRIDVVQRLVEMAENNTELDFTAVFIVCLKDNEERVREHAISGFWESEHRSIIPDLVHILDNDSSDDVRGAAATALGNFASLAQDGKLLTKDGELVRESLMRVLYSEEQGEKVRRCALESAARFNTPQVLEYILWAYNRNDIEWKCSSLYAIGRTCESEWLSLLIKELSHPAAAVRCEAANACRELAEDEAVIHLIPLLQDEEVQVQLAAVGALGEIGGRLARRALNRCIKIGDPLLEEASWEALQAMDAIADPLAFRSEQ